MASTDEKALSNGGYASKASRIDVDEEWHPFRAKLFHMIHDAKFDMLISFLISINVILVIYDTMFVRLG